MHIETPILWLPDAKSWLIWKDPDAGKDRGREERGTRMRWLVASPTWWTWVWVDSGSWWRTGRPGVLQFMGSQRVRHSWATELNGEMQMLRDSLVAQLVKNLPAMRETWVWSLAGEGKGYPLQYSGREHSTDCRVHGVAKSWTRLSDFHFQNANRQFMYFLIQIRQGLGYCIGLLILD